MRASLTTIILVLLAGISVLGDKDEYGFVPDAGPEYGKAVIRNHCHYPLYVRSVGAHPLRPDQTEATGLGSPEDEKIHKIEPGGEFSEAYRESCHELGKSDKQLCFGMGKLNRQGVDFKISKDDGAKVNIITQFEYSLQQNPLRDNFRRLNYDISLLDCGGPMEGEAITDATGTHTQHQRKIENCPGYDGGLSLTFPGSTDNNCIPLHCDGREKCMSIYTWDRSRPGEASFNCAGEYHGNMVLDLCVGRSRTPPLNSSNKPIPKPIVSTMTSNLAPLAPLPITTLSHLLNSSLPVAQLQTVTHTVMITRTASRSATLRTVTTSRSTTATPPATITTKPSHEMRADWKPFVEKMVADMELFVGDVLKDAVGLFNTGYRLED